MRNVPMVKLGHTELKVSKIGFGTFDFGTRSLNISPEKGGQILTEAYKIGVNFWDTSDDYGSHPHIASALKQVPRKEVVISTKTYAKNSEEAKKSLENSLKELNTDYLDILLLHYVKSDSIDESRELLRDLKTFKAAGIVKAIGLSTHSVAVAKAAAQFEELDVIMATCCKADQAIINKFRERIPLEDGSMEDMFQALKLDHEKGKGVIAMKVLGDNTPPLVRNYKIAIKAIAQLNFVDAMVVGMRNLYEVKQNVKAITSI